MTHARSHLLTAFIGIVVTSASAVAQPLGTFRWQLLPYCNVVALNIAQQGSIYTLDGTDDRCGAGQAASARGIAFLNPNGTIGFGVTMVQPGGVPVHLEAAISLPTLNGTWRDSSGASGTFVLTPGASIGGPLRDVPTSGVPPGSITSIQLASGAVGTPAIAPNAITSAHVLDNSLTAADVRDWPLAFSTRINGSVELFLPSQLDQTVIQFTFQAQTNGQLMLNASGSFVLNDPNIRDGAVCSVGSSPDAISAQQPHFQASERTGGESSLLSVPFASTHIVPITAFTPTPIRLLCRRTLGSVLIDQPVVTGLFVASKSSQ